MSSLPSHLMVCDHGDLYDTRKLEWYRRTPLRKNYAYHHRRIDTMKDLLATLRAGPYGWPGAYPMFFVTNDGAALSFETVRGELANVLDSIKRRIDDGWRVVGCDINYEDNDLTDDHTGEKIPSAYGEPTTNSVVAG